MLGDISPLPHTPSWRGAWLSTRTTLLLPFYLNSIWDGVSNEKINAMINCEDRFRNSCLF
jgi:hypothetical protein